MARLWYSLIALALFAPFPARGDSAAPATPAAQETQAAQETRAESSERAEGSAPEAPPAPPHAPPKGDLPDKSTKRSSASARTTTSEPRLLPLAPRRAGREKQSGSGRPAPAAPDTRQVVTTGMAGLAGAILLFLLFAWGWKKTNKGGGGRLPSDVVEVLGRSPLPGRQQLQLVRCGRKLLLLCVTPQGAETLTEITDPEEVERLAALCQQASPHSASAAFREILQEFERQPARPGFVDAAPVENARDGRRRGGSYA